MCYISYKKMQASKAVKRLNRKPLDTEAALAAVQQTKATITAEEQSVIGGLGSAVAEVLAELGSSYTTCKRIGIKDEFCQQVGSQEYLWGIYGLSVDGIVKVVQSVRKSNTDECPEASDLSHESANSSRGGP